MALNPISVNVDPKNSSRNVHFGNAGNPVIAVMDGIHKGGFAASFVTQDMLGMAIPRTVTGLTRNSSDTGEKNTAYARLVAIREVLSGPSSFLIPAAMLWAIKKQFGASNDVPTSFIKGFSEHFSDFASQNSTDLKDANAIKKGFYRSSVKNLLESSTENVLSGKALEEKVDKLTDILVKIESAPKKYLWSPKKDAEGKLIEYKKTLKGEFVEEFVEIRKKYSTNPANKIEKVWYDLKPDATGTKKTLNTKVDKFVEHLMDFTNDVSKSVVKKFDPTKKGIAEFVENFAHKRAGSRFLLNMAMTTAVAMFFTVIPKLYNPKDGKNPALAGLEEPPKANGKEGK